MRTLTAKLTEDGLIAAIAQALGEPPRHLRVGIGDDAAVWKTARSHVSLITTDALVDGVHFRLEWTTPQALGSKALAVNLSDIAAMGGSPTLAVVALSVTDIVDEQWARAFYEGMATLAKQVKCAIGGGDIVRAPALTIAVTVVGEVRNSNLRLRSGARPGDYACVTGPLGLAAAGLHLFKSTNGPGSHRPSGPSKSSNGPLGPLTPQNAALLRAAYETPTPRVREGQFLGSTRSAHALMDISDGLSLDVARMARASGVDVCLDITSLKPHPAVAEFSDPLDLILHGGDDYELLTAIEPRAYEHVARCFKARFKRELTRVGQFERGGGEVWLEKDGARTQLIPRGYDHLIQH